MPLTSPETDLAVPPEVAELSQMQWGLWKRHPATRALMAFLRQYQAKLRLEHLDRWEREGGALNPVFEAEAKGRVLVCEDILTLDVNALRRGFELDPVGEPQDGDDAG